MALFEIKDNWWCESIVNFCVRKIQSCTVINIAKYSYYYILNIWELILVIFKQLLGWVFVISDNRQEFFVIRNDVSFHYPRCIPDRLNEWHASLPLCL